MHRITIDAEALKVFAQFLPEISGTDMVLCCVMKKKVRDGMDVGVWYPGHFTVKGFTRGVEHGSLRGWATVWQCRGSSVTLKLCSTDSDVVDHESLAI